ncbi:transglutaminase TgpA family protein [Frondihabitans cladoniiphilus]|uniref:Transglutaminase-like domain-containing protein n=1 Tax=Frondihabitans cladoniiphilus TaxID=715785 RepID=A0ABP8VJT0_9MICO
MVDLVTPPTRPVPPSPATPPRPDADLPDRFAPGNARWLQTAILWVALVASVGSLQPLFQGIGWWAVASGVAALVLGFAAAARAAHWPSLVAWFVGVVVAALTSTFVVSGGTAVAGVIPTSDTLERVRLLMDQARESIVGDQAPVHVSDALLAVVVVSVAAAALLIDLVSRVGRMPGLSGAVLAVIVVVPSLIPDIEPAWGWVIVAVAAFLALLIVSTGRRPSRTGVVTGVAALVVAGVVTALLPLSAVSPITGVGSATGISTGVNPVINLGNDLRRGTSVQVLSYTTTSTAGEYLKLTDIRNFSGRSWSPDPVTVDPKNAVTNLPAAPGVSDSTKRSRVTTDVSISLLRSPYLPVPVPAARVTGIDSKWKYVDASGVTVRSTTEGTQGLDYTVVSNPVAPTRSQIIASLSEPVPDMSAYLSVKGVPASITRLAERVTSGTGNKFDAAVALQDYFRSGDFTYSEDTPVQQGYDGTGLDDVETFLQRKSGYCIHFASAMAVMARTLGIPSRMAVGFLPGTQASAGTDSPWTVTSNDLHTWPELYFQGLGWVPFEPTVGQGTTAAYLQQTGTDATPAPTATPVPTATAGTTAQPTATASATPTSSTGADDSASSSTGSASSAGPVTLSTVGILVLLLLLAIPWWLRRARRRRRLSELPPDSALAAWREVVDSARDLGVDVDPGATPGATAASLHSFLKESGARDALRRLLGSLENERFGQATGEAGVQEAARAVIDGLRASSSPLRRVRASLAPRSLFVEQRPRTAE